MGPAAAGGGNSVSDQSMLSAMSGGTFAPQFGNTSARASGGMDLKTMGLIGLVVIVVVAVWKKLG